jgi:hypothetical protein
MTRRRVVLKDPVDYLKLGGRKLKKLLLGSVVIGALSLGLWHRLEQIDVGQQRVTSYVSDKYHKRPDVLLSITVFLTSGNSLNRDGALPAWNPFSNYVDCIGGGGGGADIASSYNSGGGGGGGGFVRYNNMGWLPDTISYAVGGGGGARGAGGTTHFNNGAAATTGGQGGQPYGSGGGGGGGGYAGSTGYTGGQGGSGGAGGQYGARGGGGGGGAASAGGNGGGGQPGGSGGGTGLGGSGGGTAYGTGGGGTGPPTGAGGNGGEYGGAGAGGGGGGGYIGYGGGNGGSYGGGGGGGSAVATYQGGGAGAQGLIIIVYNPLPVPSVWSISPSAGPTGGGQYVTISGSDFYNVTSVNIGGAPLTSIGVPNSNTITGYTSGGGAGTYNVNVYVAGNIGVGVGGSLYTYVPPPVVSSAAPNFGPTSGGNWITIYGANFYGVSSVVIAGAYAGNVGVVNANTITCTTPAAAAGGAPITVNGAYGAGGNWVYTYIAPPVIWSCGPSLGSTNGGQYVQISGSGFANADSVSFGGAAASGVGVINGNLIGCYTPAHGAGLVTVAVNVPGVATGYANTFTYVTPAVISSCTPNVGSTNGGQYVQLNGSGFATADNVTFGGAAATGISVINANLIGCYTPAHGAGLVTVAVNIPNVGVSQANTFTYVVPPVTASCSPNVGSLAGGQSITVSGSGFANASSITFGGVAATNMVVVNGNTITCTLPAHAIGIVDVVVSVPNVGSGVGTGIFTFVAAGGFNMPMMGL